jgi:sulfonate transport system ATP-binding protein
MLVELRGLNEERGAQPGGDTAAGPSIRPNALAIEARGLGKRWGANVVLEGLSLRVKPGEFVAIVGQSGCGKSTFLRLLAGLDRDFDGDIRLGAEARPRRPDDVRVMFQEHRLLPWLSILDNVAIGLGEKGTRASRRDASVAALAAVGLADRAGEWPSVLSGGQKQRVALARALVSKPGILALDEPLGALDALTRMEMQSLLERVWLENGFTALMVTHDAGEAVALADRVLLFRDGRVSLELEIDLERPRQRGSPQFAALEGRLLRSLMNS